MCDIAGLLAEWPFDPGRVQARLIRRGTGKTLIQLRVDLGVLEMRRDGRPDGSRPGGYSSVLHRYKRMSSRRPDFVIPPDDHPGIDREIMQYYHRRLALTALGDYRRARRDAEHGMELVAMVHRRARERRYAERLLKTLPALTLEWVRAGASQALRKDLPEEALACIEEGVRRIESLKDELSRTELTPTARRISFLKRWGRRIREAHGLGPTLEELLEEAVGREDYETAAKLRDEIRLKAEAVGGGPLPAPGEPAPPEGPSGAG